MTGALAVIGLVVVALYAMRLLARSGVGGDGPSAIGNNDGITQSPDPDEAWDVDETPRLGFRQR